MPIELASDDPAKLAAARHFGVAELFRRHAEGLIGKHRRQIIGPVGVRHITVISNFFADLLDGTMQVSDIGNRFIDHFAVGLDHEAQHAMGAGMLRPNIDGHLFGVKACICGVIAHQ